MSPEVNIIVRAKDEATRVLQDIGGGLQTLGGAFLAFGAVAGAALVGVGVGLGRLALDEAKMGPIKKAFDNLAISIGTTADALLKKLRPATLGMLSDDELILSAQKLLTSGLAETGEEVAGFAEVATKLGLAVGKDAAGSIEGFANMLLVGGTRGLREFGLSTKEVQDRIEALQAANEDLTDQQAFQQAVMEVANETIGRTGDLSDTAAVRMAALGARFENVKDSLAESLQPALEVFLTGYLEPLVAKFEEWVPKLTPLIEVFGELAKQILVPSEGDWVTYLNTTVYDALQKVFGPEMATTITDFISKFVTEAGKFHDKLVDEILPKLQEWWKDIMEDLIPALGNLATAIMEWATSDAIDEYFGVLQKMLDMFSDLIEAIQTAIRWYQTFAGISAMLQPGIAGNALLGMVTGGGTPTATPVPVGTGPTSSSTTINVHGLPGLEDEVSAIIARHERRGH